MSANNAAKSGSSSDAMSAVGECPLKQKKLQLVPIRYALAEHEEPHSSIDSKFKKIVDFRPIGIRPLPVDGYLYVIHSQRQDIIYAYSVKTNGSVQKLEQQALTEGGTEYVYSDSEKALVVDQCGMIEVLYSRTAISPKLQSQLLDSAALRKQLMQRCAVGQFSAGKGAKHLLPPELLSTYLADCHPDISDYLDNCDSGESDYVNEFPWCWEEEKPQKIDGTLFTAQILAAYKNDAAILLLEDPIGIKTELASSYLSLSQQEQLWFSKDNNKAKYFAASQIKTLMEIGARQFKANTNNKDIVRCVDNHLDDIKQRYLDYTKASDDYWDYIKNQTVGVTYSVNLDAIYDSDACKAYLNEKQKNIDFAKEHGIDPGELEQFFKRVKQENRTLLEGKWEGLTGDRGILDRIRSDEMNSWYDDAQKRIKIWREQTELVDTDRANMLESAYGALPVFDKENKDDFLARLKLENHWLINLGEVDKNREKVRKFYFELLGEQNLHIFKSDKKDFVTLVQHDISMTELLNDIVKLKEINDNYDSTISGLSGLVDFQNLLAGRYLIPMEAMPDEIRYQLSLIGSQLSGLALEELKELSDSLKQTQSRADSLVYRAKPGLVALLLGQKKNANVELDVGTEAGNTAFDGKFTELEKIRTDAESLLSKRNSVEKSVSGTATQKDALRAEYNKQLHLLADEAQDVLDDLSARSLPIAKSGQPHPPSHITIKAAGAAADDLDEILKLRRKVLTNELLYGKTQGFGFKGSVTTGSVAFVVFIANAWNWHSTKEQFATKSQLSFSEGIEYFAGLTSFVSSGVSLTVEVLKTKVMYDWINSSTDIAKAVVGKVVTLGNLAVSFSSFAGSFLDSIKQMRRIQNSWMRGDVGSLVASSSSLVGDGIQAWHSGKIALYTGRQVMEVVAKRVTWQLAAEQTLGVVARANPYMLIASALIFAGEFAYNFLQSSPLMLWVSQCSWGKDGIWFWHKYQNWDYQTQLTKWFEVTQTPKVNIEAEQYKVEHSSPSGNWYAMLTKHRVKTIQVIIPMVHPQHVRLSGYVKVEGQKEPTDITQSNLIAQSRVINDGINTVYEFDWPQSDVNQRKFQYLDLLLEVKAYNGEILFAEQKGARFTINLQQPQALEELTDRKGWYQVQQLDEDDEQYTSLTKLETSLKELKSAPSERI
ncbi:toxin VasX [Vibrio viridaestus]|uniref:Toxin VasX N-terminal region domain-containing protein n=1 Tax=Vibrio viridaestus TaxID=2487322 RepID=A0A3N9TKZ0_9VIBR|nr:toxin VasX [Vibrio viridaestus]RQW65019.1 hypothetical protein EES38_03020 [Vibrio viridaestus]